MWVNIFLIKCTDVGKLKNIGVYLTEEVEESHSDVEDRLWCREIYWQSQLLTTWDW